jgi:hypothetical protein
MRFFWKILICFSAFLILIALLGNLVLATGGWQNDLLLRAGFSSTTAWLRGHLRPFRGR